MKEYRVHWHACPHSRHSGKIMFVEAESEKAAREIATDHIERKHGVAWFTIKGVSEYTRPVGGRVIA